MVESGVEKLVDSEYEGRPSRPFSLCDIFAAVGIGLNLGPDLSTVADIESIRQGNTSQVEMPKSEVSQGIQSCAARLP